MIGIHNAIVGNKAQSFASVDEWTSGGIPNIIKTPVTSIQIPRKIRVGQDNFLLDANENSSDRLRDTILPFARGVNPMVSVQMQNSGNVFKNSTQTSLPYKLQAFRPPIVKLEDTLPLSRLHRLPTKVITLPKISSNEKPYQEISKLQTCPLTVEFTSHQISKPVKKYYQDINLNHARVQTRENDIQQNLKRREKINFENPKVFLTDPLNINVKSKISQSVMQAIEENLNADRYITDNTSINVETNKNYNLHQFPEMITQYELDKIIIPIHVTAQKNYFLHDLLEMPDPILNNNRINVEYINSKILPKKYETFSGQTNGKRIQIPFKVHQTNIGFETNHQEHITKHNPIQVSTRKNMTVEKDISMKRILPTTRDRAVSRHGYFVG